MEKKRVLKMLRQPIVVVVGHVDHGKTTLLDAIRKTRVADKESGAITQHISASEVGLAQIKSRCGNFLDKMKIKFTIPGLLFIDTPGHEAFANLRKRGGSIADIAILVVDVNQGLQKQTIESMQILKQYKTGFVVAATKIDAIDGWKSSVEENVCFSDSNKNQRKEVAARLDERLYKLVGELYEKGFSAERFDRIEDFTKQIAIIPVSARTGEGLSELLSFVSGLAQKFLDKKLELHATQGGKASVMEVKEVRGLGMTIDAILYDGTISEGDEIAFATSDGPTVCKVKTLLKPKIAAENAANLDKFDSVKTVSAAAGIKIVCEQAGDALAGSSLYAVNGGNKQEILEQIRAEVNEIIVESQNDGIILKTDALGSLEALVKLLGAENIPIHRASIGKVNKSDVQAAKAFAGKNKFNSCVLAFNTQLEAQVPILAKDNDVKIISNSVVYNLIDEYKRWVEQVKSADKKQAFSRLVRPAKIEVIGPCFRACKPCIVGIEVVAGTLSNGVTLVNAQGEKLGEVKGLQHDKEALSEAKRGMQVAMALEGPTFGRQLKEKEFLTVLVPKEHARVWLEKYSASLSAEEKNLLK
ncbi:translation initiation factor IF-2 [Candidatus Micrarchaeota archaeon]|nr:translation initiation factor IF-2 [Candidatus Micrarchaeota archaeon]